jgi:ornithine decarboxylase
MKNEQLPNYIVDLTALEDQVNLWKSHMPNIKIHYAVKSFCADVIVRKLYNIGCGFDCASMKEIAMVNSITSQHGSNIIFANTVKPLSHIEYAINNGVNIMTFDSIEELHKIFGITSNVKLVMRLNIDNPNATSNFGLKFGVIDEDIPSILEYLHCRDVQLHGLSFHVGSGNRDPNMFEYALNKCFALIKLLNYPIKMIDLGGGFVNDDTFVPIADRITNIIGPYIKSINFIAEPGRFISSSCLSSHVQITSKRTRNGIICYTINDSVYGMFGSKLGDHREFTHDDIIYDNTLELIPTIIFGQTCDSIDQITNVEMLPMMNIGDTIIFKNMGAYGYNVMCEFNGFKNGSLVVVP